MGKFKDIDNMGRYVGHYDSTGLPVNDKAFCESVEYIVNLIGNGHFIDAEKRIKKLNPSKVAGLMDAARDAGMEEDVRLIFRRVYR